MSWETDRYRSDPEYRERKKAASRAYRAANPNRSRDRRRDILRRYEMTPEQFEEMSKEQDGMCLICGREVPLVVDHDHLTGKVRGLLCRTCNSGLGQFRDDRDLLRAAIEYLSATR